MSLFDLLDQQASEAVGSLLNERVVWRPQVMDRNAVLTGDDRYEDPNRPVRGEGNDELWAIVTIKSCTMQVGQGMDTPTGVVVADCVVDFDSLVFRRPDGSWSMPRKGDIFELLEELPGNRMYQVDQRGDDGAARLLFFCSVYR